MVAACKPALKSTPDQRSENKLTEWFNKGEWKQGWTVAPDETINRKEFAAQYFRNQVRWGKAFKFLQDENLAVLAKGRYEREGGDLFVNVDEYMTKNKDDVRWWLIAPGGSPTFAITTVGSGLVADVGNPATQTPEFISSFGTTREPATRRVYQIYADQCGFNGWAGWTGKNFANISEEKYLANEKYMHMTQVLNLSNAGDSFLKDGSMEFPPSSPRGKLQETYQQRDHRNDFWSSGYSTMTISWWSFILPG